jgi:hypothetical protein
MVPTLKSVMDVIVHAHYEQMSRFGYLPSDA